ncbi:MAG: hypothetical protein LBD20_01955 [Spirochaetaceae bacterium]|jgi:hypothetical protein|nr:hypothetical protein [Spirochaetaceae bacterium]
MPFKKRVYVAIFCCIFYPVSAAAEFSIGGGPEGGFSFEKTAGASSMLIAPGAAVSLFSTPEDSIIGLFFHFSFLFPVLLEKKTGGTEAKVDLSYYDFLFQASALLGAGFRFDVGGAFRLNLGVGPEIFGLLARAEKKSDLYSAYNYSLSSLNIGIGTVVEISLEALAPFYIALGTVLSYNFLNYTVVSSPNINQNGWAKEYALFSVRPYICFGYHFESSNEDD